MASKPNYSEAEGKYNDSIDAFSDTGLSGLCSVTDSSNTATIQGRRESNGSMDTFSLSNLTDSSNTANRTMQVRRESNYSLNTVSVGGLSGLTDSNSTANVNRTKDRRESLLRASFSTYVSNIGEVNEDTEITSDEAQKAVMRLSFNSNVQENVLKRFSFGSMKTDDIMSIRSRRQSIVSRRDSGLSNLDDLSYLTGRSSMCEMMSFGDSGIFSMDEDELADWTNEAIQWEIDAEMEDNQEMQEDLEGLNLYNA